MSTTRIVSALSLVAGSLVGVAATVALSTPAYAEPVPPAPAGWTTVFGDDFAGPAGSPPAAANWFYDIGTGFGTGEKEHTTNSTQNVYLDGSGHLVLKAINSGGTWTSGRIESTRSDFSAPPGGKLQMSASLRQPDPANGLGYWPAFWALGSPMRTGGGWPQSGEIDMMEDVNALNQASQTLHHASGSQGHGLIACPATGSTCQSGYHTYSVIIDRTNTSAESLQFLMDGVVESTITQAQVGTSSWQQAIDHGFFMIFDLAIGGNYPDGIAGSTTPTAATTSGGSMSVAWAAVYEQGGDSTPTGRPTAQGRITGINGLCLSNTNSLNAASNPIGVQACNGSAGQQWATYSDNTVRVQGGCLDVVAAGRTSGTNVDWYPCNGSNAQVWTRQGTTLTNPNSGLCLSDPGGNTAARLVIETCNGSAQQQWTLPTGSTPGNTVTVANPGNQTQAVGNATNLAISATDSAAGQTLTYSATGLPPGLTINPSTGVISGGPTTAGTYTVTVTATDTTGASGSTTFTWTVTTGQGPGCGTTNIARNGHATSSSNEGAGLPPSNAIDGNPATRWASAFSDPQWITIDLGSAQPICNVVLNWEAAYARAFQLQTSNDGTNWTTIYTTTTGTGGVQTLNNLTASGRYIRMYGTLRATAYGYSLWEFEVYGGSGTTTGCATSNAALGHPATASSVQSGTFPAASAFDGNTGTRWSSAASDPQWLQVDLGATQNICRIGLNWEAAYARAFQIQVSGDGTNWTTVYNTTTGTGGVQTLDVTGSGRYVRMYGTQRATQYGYSLWEFSVSSRFTP